jgi:hypothetical protein
MYYKGMPTPGKEIEQRIDPDEIALREVEGYIERTEKQAETAAQNQTTNQQQITPQQSVPSDMGKVVATQAAASAQQKIVLPLDKTQMEEGLHHKVMDGIKWLAEWCVMMIKKYPGRVFYLPPSSQ